VIWLAPTEGKVRAILQAQEDQEWRISTLPEKHGCDLIIPTRAGAIGFQRKTLPDLVSSVQDGRLYYELNQLNSSATVNTAFLIVESSFSTTVDGTSYTDANISVSTLRSIVAKFHHFGIGYLPTANPTDTLAAATSVSKYLANGRVGDIHRTKQVSNVWGQTDAKSYGTFLLQSFPGIGPKMADAIYDYFSGVPLTWAVDAGQLAQVPGIGRKKAEALIASVRPAGPKPSPGPA
jgi:DNA excision repair protein ERCC-4